VATVLPETHGGSGDAPDHLRRSMLRTYFNLRIAMSVLAFTFPVIFYVYWRRVGPGPLHLDSISAFYGTNGIARDLFVAILCAIGSFLIAYRSLTIAEGWLLNLAGCCAALVATVPCTCWGDGPHSKSHITFAVSFFALMAGVMLGFARKTIKLLPERWRGVFSWAYLVNGVSFLASISAVIILNLFLPHYTKYVFRIEWLGVWSFGAYWGLKTWEYWISDFEKKAATGQVKYHAKNGFVPLDWSE
jgi:hypothetical protein